MIRYDVRVDGKVVGTRKSGREYTHALVVERVTISTWDRGLRIYTPHRPVTEAERYVVASFHRSAQLAERARAGFRFHQGERMAFVLPVERVELKRRERIRCTGLAVKIHGDGTAWAFVRAEQCLRDAKTHDGALGWRCDRHLSTDNDAVRAEAAQRNELAKQARLDEWAADHGKNFTFETCQILKGSCPVHTAPGERGAEG